MNNTSAATPCQVTLPAGEHPLESPEVICREYPMFVRKDTCRTTSVDFVPGLHVVRLLQQQRADDERHRRDGDRVVQPGVDVAGAEIT